MLNKILVGVAGAAVVGGLGYMACRRLKKDTPADLSKVAVEAVDTALQGVKADLAKPAPVVTIPKSELENIFAGYHAAIAKVIPFDASWKNGTDYLDGAMKVKLDAGATAKSTDDHGRRVILIGSDKGTLVMFERYTPGKGPFVIVHNTPMELRAQVPSGNLNLSAFTQVFADFAGRK